MIGNGFILLEGLSSFVVVVFFVGENQG